jgi:hypothetical protein
VCDFNNSNAESTLQETKLPTPPEDKFFNKLEDDVSKIVQQEKRREQFSNNTDAEVTTSTEHEPVRLTANQFIPSIMAL